MTREEARKAAEVMLAYANGKNLQMCEQGSDEWVGVIDPVFNWAFKQYRIIPEPKYRPFKDMEECFKEMRKHDPFGIVESKANSNRICIALLPDEFDELFNEYNFADGSPFGVKED